MRPLGILVAGEALAETLVSQGGFDALVQRATGAAWPGVWQVVDCRTREPPDLDRLAGLVVTGSPASVTERQAWMLRLQDTLREAAAGGTLVLGICFGHQILAEALGGRAGGNPKGREIGTVEVRLCATDRLLGAQGEAFAVNMTHVDTVLQLPAGARVLASTALEPHAAVRWSERVWSVQFHPEFDAEVLHAYLRGRRAELVREGFDLLALEQALADTPRARSVLARFAQLVVAAEQG